MSTFKCKMCGGALEITENQTVCECEYCGSKQTLPKLSDDKKANMYDRANHFRRNNDFDKAMGIYEQILNEDNTDSEAYWSLVLCRYGIEYVEDPATHKRIPTVNRAQYTSIFDDDNYKSALQYADTLQKSVYEEEAKNINEIQKGILEISQKEEPFDVFICYKETDNNGRRTQDSVLANDLYHQLTQEGLKVFFARITLEDKLGSAYEPYIFAALNSAKVMVVLGTKAEYFTAVWVKNEWSRYLSLVKQSNGKKMLIPAYRDMDPYDLPEEFSHLQAQDMGKLGFMQDLIRGIKKILQVDEPKKQTSSQENSMAQNSGNSNIAPLLKRVFMFLEDKDWASATEYCEKVLDVEPECADAYLGKLMAQLKVSNRDNLKSCQQTFDDNSTYKKAFKFGDESTKTLLVNANNTIRYNNAESAMNTSQNEQDYKKAAQMYLEITRFLDADDKSKKCFELAEIARKDAILSDGLKYKSRDKISELNKAIEMFTEIKAWKNASELIDECKERITAIEAKQQRDEIARKDGIYAEGVRYKNDDTISSVERAIESFKSIPDWKDADSLLEESRKRLRELEEKRDAESRKAKKKKKKTIIAIVAATVACIIFLIVLNKVIIPANKYNKAMNFVETGKYDEAEEILAELGDYKDCAEQLEDIPYKKAMNYIEMGEYDSAEEILVDLGDYKDSEEQMTDVLYKKALKLIETEKYDEAEVILVELGDYKDSAEQLTDIPYKKAMNYIEMGEYDSAEEILVDLGDYKDSEEQMTDVLYKKALKLIETGDYDSLGMILIKLSNNEDRAEQITDVLNEKVLSFIQAGDYISADLLLRSIRGRDWKDINSQRRKIGLQVAKQGKVGDTFIFGKYEWQILAKEDNKLLVITTIKVYDKPYNGKDASITWEKCSLRKWLNNEFYNEFSSEEQSVIASTHLENKNNAAYGTNGGNSTDDNIFLLSIDEANKYFSSDSERAAGGFWWLRSPGESGNYAAGVSYDGEVSGCGRRVDTHHSGVPYVCGVRPALWISLD